MGAEGMNELLLSNSLADLPEAECHDTCHTEQYN
jgi:hypothetical protein